MTMPVDRLATDRTDTFRECYLSTGRKATFYTLRRMIAGPGFCNDHYVKRLYTDLDRSLEAAKLFAERTGMNFTGIHDEPMYKFGEFQTALKEARERNWADDLGQGIMPWGKHKGKALDDLPGGYIAFIVDKLDDMDFMSDEFRVIMREALQTYADAHKAWVEEKKAEWEEKKVLSDYVGEVKVRLKGIKVVVETVKRDIEGYYGYYDIIAFRDENGNKLVYMGGSGIDVKEKKSYVIDATVKAHEEYKGEKQTKVSRVKLVKEITE